MDAFKSIEKVMTDLKSTPVQISLFKDLYSRFISDKNKKTDWSTISTPTEEAIIDYSSLEEIDYKKSKDLLSKVAMCRLNGGLGTSMGCIGPKSAIEVKDGKTFLDFIVAQIQALNEDYQVNVPLILMNSFSTDHDTKKIIEQYNDNLTIQTFQQNEFPRLRRDSLMPLNREEFGDKVSYPPGHGDFYYSIMQSGILDDLIEQGIKYIYIANSDNLGASIDLKILNLLESSKAPFLMEVTDKTRADIKGGTLITTKENSLQLLEIAQVPEDYKEEFKSVKKFKIFNTNNVWIDILELKKKLLSYSLQLDVIVNKKVVNRHPVIQLETAIGSGINSFEGSLAVKVPRKRFLPVKKTDDLLLIQSNLFTEEKGLLIKNPDRQFEGLPLIRLGEKFRTVESYQKRIKEIPNILELDLLTIVGNVYFGKKVTLQGNVILICDGDELHISNNSFIENQVMTGNIMIGEL